MVNKIKVGDKAPDFTCPTQTRIPEASMSF